MNIRKYSVPVLALLMGVMTISCGKKQVQETETMTEMSIDTMEEVETEVTEIQQEYAGFDYEIMTVDGSRKDDNGNVLAAIYMQYPHIKGGSDAADAINEYYMDICTHYSPLNSGLFEYLDEAIAQGDMSVFPYEDYYGCTVGRNDGEYLSVVRNYVWYAGGVMNCGNLGETFDAHTGAKVTLLDLYPDLTEDAVRQKVVDAVQTAISADPDSFYPEDGYLTGALAVIGEYEVEEYNFYMADGKVYVCFGPYEIGYGGYGKDIVIDTYDEDAPAE